MLKGRRVTNEILELSADLNRYAGQRFVRSGSRHPHRFHPDDILTRKAQKYTLKDLYGNPS